ncbi:Acetoacetyl-coenzyme A synthetase [Rhodovastum atsumiense]|uniref:Acetoacetate--CoA ligase n=1 Tax=Rhodovastum atsumiense TaxID=504468 RepID=A0A5M6IPR0_9PROT|nr:acetoacetate--CoA ligase [Rhodovastum atsumiense]KAA5610273.1 acetoacetate--CoA ligase [Rhodovastum atsumiense]CAH2602240.1 Acetoacetyl-coenzyme A synthetase [Rhodovastum atsumiense]
MSTILWQPSPEQIGHTQIRQFAVAAGFTGADAEERLWQWSADQPAAFWEAIWTTMGVRAARPAEVVLENPTAMPGARWFVGARLNYAENLLRRRDDTPALIFRGEDGSRREVSWACLHEEVARIAAALRSAGVGVGDRVGAYLPNLPEAVIAMLATSSLGAVWSSCSPDFGVPGVLDRFGQIEPKVLVAVDGYHYAGKAIDITAKVQEVRAALPSVRQVIVVPFLDPRRDAGFVADGLRWDEAGRGEVPELTFAQLPFNHPLYVLYSSGTTGKPKAIVHGQGGTLLQHLKEHRLHSDIRPGERVFYFTTCGWMMWNWLVGALAAEATLVLFDGNPFHPGPEALWQLAEQEQVAVFGISAKYIDTLRKYDYRPREGFHLKAMRAILSTGSPLLPESFDYVYKSVKREVQLISMSGGTDIISCFVLGNPAGPVRRGEIQMRGLGMAVEIWNDEGRPVRGEKGELVCTKPFPCMPLGFWNDPDGTRYRAAYFEKFPGVWCHGDYAELTESGGIIIHGRSDAVLNPGGVRIGTAEIYRQVERIDEVLEALCVGQDWDGDVRVVLFVRLRPGVTLDDPLRERIRRRIRDHASPRHVPARIIQVTDLPRTLSGKITELAVRDVIHGRRVKNTEALQNPDALAAFRDLPELRN